MLRNHDYLNALPVIESSDRFAARYRSRQDLIGALAAAVARCPGAGGAAHRAGTGPDVSALERDLASTALVLLTRLLSTDWQAGELVHGTSCAVGDVLLALEPPFISTLEQLAAPFDAAGDLHAKTQLVVTDIAAEIALLSFKGALDILVSRPLLSIALRQLAPAGGAGAPGPPPAAAGSNLAQAGVRPAAMLLENTLSIGGEALSTIARGTDLPSAASLEPCVLGAASALGELGPALPRALAAEFRTLTTDALEGLRSAGGGGSGGQGASGGNVVGSPPPLHCSVWAVLSVLKWTAVAPRGGAHLLEASLAASDDTRP